MLGFEFLPARDLSASNILVATVVVPVARKTRLIDCEGLAQLSQPSTSTYFNPTELSVTKSAP